MVNNLTAVALTTGEVRLQSDGTPWRPLVHIEDISRAFLAMLEAPIIEVHISDVEHREEWRRHSVIGDVVQERILGHGIDGYREALERLAGRAVATG